MLAEESLTELANDIRQHGLREPIILFEGKVLDGRNRLAASRLAGVTPRFETWKPRAGDSPLSFVASLNLHRRHLSASQRAAIAVEVEAMISAQKKAARAAAKRVAAAQAAFSHAQSAPTTRKASSAQIAFGPGDLAAEPANPSGGAPAAAQPKPFAGRARDLAAHALNVSSSYVWTAKNLAASDPELFGEVRRGEKSLEAASKEAAGRANDPDAAERLKAGPGRGRPEEERPAPGKRHKVPVKKFGKVSSSRVQLMITATFGNPAAAEEYLNKMEDDKRVLEFTYKPA